MKKENVKVGRPKLADKSLKRQSLLVCFVGLSCIFIIGVLFYKIIEMDTNPSLLVGKAYNDHINSCIVNNSKIDCGPNVKYMKYSVNNNNYIEVNKTDESIEVNLDNINNIKVCYKTNSDKLTCIK